MKIIVVTHRRDSVAAWAFHIHEVGVWVLENNIICGFFRFDTFIVDFWTEE